MHGKVVVDQRVGVNHLHGGSGVIGKLSSGANGLGGGVGEQGSQPLAAASAL